LVFIENKKKNDKGRYASGSGPFGAPRRLASAPAPPGPPPPPRPAWSPKASAPAAAKAVHAYAWYRE